jgi:hypothetical protein
MITKPTILAIVGVSGSGKSILEKNLISDFGDVFYKLQQFTTRAMRPGERAGDPYIFIQRSTFGYIQDELIGVLGTRPNSLYKDLYGSLPDFVDNKIATIILAEESLEDLMWKVSRDNHIVSGYNVIVIGLDVAWEELSLEGRMTHIGRDDEFITRERQVLQHANMIWRDGNGKYANPREVVDYLVSTDVLKDLYAPRKVIAKRHKNKS